MDIRKKDNSFALCDDAGAVLGTVEFIEKGDHIVITHTHVNQELREQGLAAQLILETIDYAKNKNLKIGATCSYAKNYLSKHKEELKDMI